MIMQQQCRVNGFGITHVVKRAILYFSTLVYNSVRTASRGGLDQVSAITFQSGLSYSQRVPLFPRLGSASRGNFIVND
jgi:hypothetical protein